MSAAKAKPCKHAGDDVAHAKRPVVAGVPGPRCATCARQWRKATRTAAHASRLRKVYQMTPQAYAAIVAAQGGVCAICRRATGATRRLSVDHDHACCPGPVSCGRCVRGALCRPCNDLLGHLRDDPEAFARAEAYLRRPPAQAVLLALDDDGQGAESSQEPAA